MSISAGLIAPAPVDALGGEGPRAACLRMFTAKKESGLKASSEASGATRGAGLATTYRVRAQAPRSKSVLKMPRVRLAAACYHPERRGCLTDADASAAADEQGALITTAREHRP